MQEEIYQEAWRQRVVLLSRAHDAAEALAKAGSGALRIRTAMQRVLLEAAAWWQVLDASQQGAAAAETARDAAQQKAASAEAALEAPPCPRR